MGVGKRLMKWGLLTAAIILPHLSVCALPGYADISYRDVSRSINESFSGNLNNIFTFALTVLAVIAGVLAIRLLRPGKKEDAGPERRGFQLRPLGNQQKRSWFRLKTNAEFMWIHSRNALRVTKEQYNKDRLIDISGGGLCFRTAGKLNPGDKISILLDAGEDKTLSLKGQVLRVEEDTSGDGAMRRVSVQFDDLPDGHRDRIVSLIMKRQRETIINTKEKGGSPPSGH